MDTFFPGPAIGIGLGFVICIVAHHVAHARVSIAQGDWTPKQYGRTSLSIKAHADTLGTIILPIVWVVVAFFGSFFAFVGWGKAQTTRFQQGRAWQTTVLNAIAGPVATLVVGIAAGAITRGLPDGSFVKHIVGGIAVVGILLFAWEILPLPGRDGARVLGAFLSPTARMKIQDLAEYEVAWVAVVLLIEPLRNVVTGIATPICNAAAGVPVGGCVSMLFV